jgi:hypothetical protein
MNTTSLFRAALIGIWALTDGSLNAAENSTRVQLIRTPNSGLQPQATMDARGLLHMVYFKGEAKAGDLFYVRQAPGREEFSAPLQVNNVAASAIAVGTIRGAQLAVTLDGRVHVAWNGTKAIEGAPHTGAPMWYARLNDAGTAFEPQRDLMQFTGGLDGGGAIAADGSSNVYVFWHGAAPDNARGEEGRGVFMTRSTDGGNTFAREIKVNPRDTGACACCGMRALADDAGNLFTLYRAAGAKVNRDEILLLSRDRGRTFAVVSDHGWKAATCPMSSAALVTSRSGTIAAWETADQIYFLLLDPKTQQPTRPLTPPGVGRRKHPVTAVNSKGELLIAWTEGTGWQRGGSVAWQLFDASGSPLIEKGRAPGVPVWGLAAAVARADGGFVIFY